MIKDFFFDVIVLGAGGAGCSAAIAAAREGVSVALVSKESIAMGNTRICEAEMTSSGVLPEDSPEVLKMDMIKGGEYLNNYELVDLIAKNASAGIQFVESLGHFFRRDEEGRLSAKAANRLGGHTYHRSFLSPGAGVGLSRALLNTVANTDGITVFEDALLFSLLTEDNRVRGALIVDLKTSDCFVMRGKATILATGGCGWLYYPQTTNNRSATGDGFAVAYEAGAKLVDMEMVQFFPFAMNHPPRYAGTILEEPVLAGPKGKLINGLGEIVADRDINRMTRAQVTALMAKEIAAGRTSEWGGLKLDLSGNLDVPEMLHYKKVNDERKRYEKVRKAYGEGAFNWTEPWDVSPSAHYMMGGVRIDRRGRSNLYGLFTAGEAAGGAMGANRLGSTSLADIFVMGIESGREAALLAATSQPPKVRDQLIKEECKRMQDMFGKSGRMRPIQIKRKLQELMRENVGIARDEKRLNGALREIDRLEETLDRDVSIASTKRYNTEFLDAVELRNMLRCAKMIATCARMRTETRGAHLRLDFPDKNDSEWLKNIIVWKEGHALGTAVTASNALQYGAG